jgi:hypothetical protein
MVYNEIDRHAAFLSLYRIKEIYTFVGTFCRLPRPLSELRNHHKNPLPRMIILTRIRLSLSHIFCTGTRRDTNLCSILGSKHDILFIFNVEDIVELKGVPDCQIVIYISHPVVGNISRKLFS